MCHPKLHLLKKDSCDHLKGQLGSGHRLFSALKITLEVVPKSQPSKATISEPFFINSETLGSQIIVPGTFFAEKGYMGAYARQFFLSQSGCPLDACTRSDSEVPGILVFNVPTIGPVLFVLCQTSRCQPLRLRKKLWAITSRLLF